MHDYRFSENISIISLHRNSSRRDIACFPFTYKESYIPIILKNDIRANVLELEISVWEKLISNIQKEEIQIFWNRICMLVKVITPELLVMSGNKTLKHAFYSHKKKEEHLEMRKNIHELFRYNILSPKSVNTAYDFLLTQEIAEFS
jgi:hypothetical protein